MRAVTCASRSSGRPTAPSGCSIERLGDGVDDLFAQLEPWSTALVGDGGYPASVSALFG